MSPDVDLDTLAREEVIDFICDSTMRPDAPPSFNSEKRAFIENVCARVSLVRRSSCRTRITSTMCAIFLRFWGWIRCCTSLWFGSMCERVCIWESRFLVDEWSELLIRMFEACKTESDERKLILQFIESCLSFIDKCVYYGIFDSLKIGTTQHSAV